MRELPSTWQRYSLLLVKVKVPVGILIRCQFHGLDAHHSSLKSIPFNVILFTVQKQFLFLYILLSGMTSKSNPL